MTVKASLILPDVFSPGWRLRPLFEGLWTAAASLLEAEIVTAEGVIRVVNDAREPDLFLALKGGGGGTFGIVIRFTLATHPLPETLGAVSLVVKARSDEAFR